MIICLIWKIDSESIHVRKVARSAELSERLRLVGREGGKASSADLQLFAKALIAPVTKAIQTSESLAIIAEGALEFLPWAALPLGDKTLIETVQLTFVSSLAHRTLSESKKNLYNSRILGVAGSGVRQGLTPLRVRRQPWRNNGQPR